MKIIKSKLGFIPINILLETEEDYLLLIDVLCFYMDNVDPDDKIDVEYNKICEFKNRLQRIFAS